MTCLPRNLSSLWLFAVLVSRNTLGFVPSIPTLIHLPAEPSFFFPVSIKCQKSRTELYGVRSLARRIFQRLNRKAEEKAPSVTSSSGDEEIKSKQVAEELGLAKKQESEHVSVCIVGGGVSGLTAAITCAQGLAKKNPNAKVVLLEAASDVGGRVRSDKTEDGYTLDRGFAVFIEEYPQAQKLLVYSALNLGQFLPGALVKVPDLHRLARIADPLRDMGKVFDALMAPLGDFFDKVRILSLVLHVKSKTIEELFAEEETSTKDALTKRWMFSEQILGRFFKPFLEGIFLAPIEEQSSRMFFFVFKMFSEGSAALPKGGIGAVSSQLALKARNEGVDIRLDTSAGAIIQEDGNKFSVVTRGGKHRILADTLVVATDGVTANNLIAQIKGFESLQMLPAQVQRSVGNLYYGFKGEPPVSDPILILNGIDKERGKPGSPVNNICFPSVVAEGYAPEGHNLCSVTVLKDAMDHYEGRDKELDTAVRKQLGEWFPDYKSDILNEWELKHVYRIQNAQPGHFKGPFPANVQGGRASNTYRNKELPENIFVCGDHMSTATLNGALESGVQAGQAVLRKVPKA